MILGAAAQGVFDQFEWTLVVAPILPAVAAVLTVTHRLAIRAGAAIAAIAATVMGSILAANGCTAGLGEAPPAEGPPTAPHRVQGRGGRARGPAARPDPSSRGP